MEPTGRRQCGGRINGLVNLRDSLANKSSRGIVGREALYSGRVGPVHNICGRTNPLHDFGVPRNMPLMAEEQEIIIMGQQG